MTPRPIGRVDLHSTVGGADKVYAVWLEPADIPDLYTVETSWGPRGGWVQAARKTRRPVPLDKAEAVRDELVRAKTAKGYKVVSNGTGPPAVSRPAGDAPVETGLLPMLLTPATEADIEWFVRDDAWCGQPKINGKRILARCTSVRPAVLSNRRGLACPGPQSVVMALQDVAECVLDGELVGDVYHVFDLIEFEGIDWRGYSMRHRYTAAANLAIRGHSAAVRIVPTAWTTKEKRALVASLRRGRKEGAVFKRVDAPYEPGLCPSLANATALKVKFYAEGNFRVVRWNSEKASVEIAAADGTVVGNVTVPGCYADQVRPGVVLRVRYLYATGANRLYQPTVDPDDAGLVVRDDADLTAVSELKHEGKT